MGDLGGSKSETDCDGHETERVGMGRAGDMKQKNMRAAGEKKMEGSVLEEDPG